MPEQRCTDLGSNCICSEPLQATAYPEVATAYRNPNDSATKECSVDGVTGGSVVRNSSDITASTDATALAALPSGHSVARFLKAGDNHTGSFFVGNNTTISSSNERIAMRWYTYRTPTYEFKGEGSCTNSKLTEFDHNSRIDMSDVSGGNVNFHTYNYLEFSPAVDCCSGGPGPNASVPRADMVGKWWRYEAVLTNREGPDYRLEMFGKNVTDDDPEIQIIDLWDDPSVDNLTPPGLMSQLLVNNYRETACVGWIGTSHYMVAAWSTNDGQRIGAAEEIEGGEEEVISTISRPMFGGSIA